MGMQISFDLNDVENAGGAIMLLNNSGYWIADISFPGGYSLSASTGSRYARWAWFDCGSGSQAQMSHIKALIANRIPFNAA